jgi:hypothetical protein
VIKSLHALNTARNQEREMSLDIVQFDYKADSGGAIVTASDESLDASIELAAVSDVRIGEDCSDALQAVLGAFRKCVSPAQSDALRKRIIYALAA